MQISFGQGRNGNDKYFVEGQIISLRKKLHIFDDKCNEVALVKQRIVSFRPKFIVEINGDKIAEIVKEITFFAPKYYVAGLNWMLRTICLLTIML